MQLNDSVTTLKQISGKYAAILEKLGIYTIKDLLTYFPYKYNDSSTAITIKDLIFNGDTESDHLIKVTVNDFKSGFLRSRKTIQEAHLVDETGEIKATWFNQPYLKDVFKEGREFLVLGKLAHKGKTFQFYPKLYEQIIEGRENVHLGRIAPEYNLTEGITKKWFRNRMKSLVDSIDQLEIKDELKEAGSWKLEAKDSKESEMSEMDLKGNIAELHFPSDSDKVNKATDNLSLYELTHIQLKLEQRRQENEKYNSVNVKDIDTNKIIKDFLDKLHFKLTADQKSIVDDTIERIRNNELINELIQGDVGSGKTIIAVIISLIMSKAGYQTVILAPTTILAKQHFKTFENYLKDSNVEIELVTSDNKDTKAKDILIGTSAVLARKKDLIKKLGLIVVDEQHRFGVMQREELLEPFADIIDKKCYPHFINMSATPIPRTIAQAFFGDLTVSTIKTKPVGRLPIKTFLVEDKKRKDSYKWIQEELLKGHQAYWVCPLVTESDKLDKVKSAEEMYVELRKELKGVKVGLIHGQMKEAEKTEVMKDFLEHKLDILVSTSVIEVGIDVPNSTIMIIENAERFGLAQLHQIRGRVGRSDKQSWCFLFYDKDINSLALLRLQFLSQNDDGLKIAEFDLQNRGPGEIYGLKQSGLPNLKIAKLTNLDLIKESKKVAEELYKRGVREIELFS